MKKFLEKVKKRDGRIVPFQKEKIEEAIFKAAKAVGGKDRETAKKLADRVVHRLKKKFGSKTPTVEQIQDEVEKELIESGHAKTAKAYILYRAERNKIRDTKAFLEKSADIIEEYVLEKSWRVKENSNASYSLSGLQAHVSDTIISEYTLKNIYPPEISKAHKNAAFHLHDLGVGTFAAYCAGWSLRQLLEEGFNGVPGRIAAKPAKHFNAALGQMVNFMGTMQNEWAGAQAFSSFDTYLAPLAAKDNLSYERIKQSIQEFVFAINATSRWGNQVPFTNITLDWTVPEDMKAMPAIWGGRELKETYSDFQHEMDLINKAFIEVMSEGDMNGRIFTFPIPTYNITREFDWDSENANMLFEMTAKYGTPYFQNFINSSLKPEDVRSMCLHPEEEILVREGERITRVKIGEFVETYACRFDGDGWSDINRRAQIASINPETLEVEWVNIKSVLKVNAPSMKIIKTRDGKVIRVSENHVLVTLCENGLKEILARDIKKGDYLLSIKNGEKLLNDKEVTIADITLSEDLAKVLGFFTADGNYLFESRKERKNYGSPKGIQFTFNSHNKKTINEIRSLLKKVFNHNISEKKDPRYNTYYLFIYNSKLARKLYDLGFRKYGRLPSILFSSPKKVIAAFLNYFFIGDGYKKRNEIHINDSELARDIVLLYSMVGQPAILRERECSQCIYLPKKKAAEKINGNMNNPLIHEQVPGFFAKSTYLVPGLNKNRNVGLATLQKYSAETELAKKIRKGDVYATQVTEVNTREEECLVYDVELEKNHLFVHSLGTVTHNCCRLQLDVRELRQKTGGLFGSGEKTGSIGVVTINMPQLGYLSKNENDFFERLDYLMYLAKEALEIKRKEVEKNMKNGLLPWSKRYLGTFDYHFSTIGLNGMNECCLNFLSQNIAGKDGRKFALKTLDFMRGKLQDFQEETGNIYNLEATPAEGASYRLARIDKNNYPEIITAGTKEAPYYTNSTHLPVDYTDDIFSALEHQDELQCKYTGGTVLHGFLGEKMSNGKACKKLVRTIAYNFKLPYFTITPTFSICPVHGYISGKHYTCPVQTGQGEKMAKCGKQTEVYSRVVGYYRPVQQWNIGKTQEFSERKTYSEKKAIARAERKK